MKIYRDMKIMLKIFIRSYLRVYIYKKGVPFLLYSKSLEVLTV